MKLKHETSRTYPDADSDKEISIEDINSYYLELKDLLRHVETSQTYYQVLNLDRLATLQQIRAAYQRSLNLLFPPYALSSGIPLETQARMERAFEKTSRAFSVLALSQKRHIYDSALSGRDTSATHSLEGDRASVSNQRNRRALPSFPVNVESKVIDRGVNRRRAERIRIPLPVRVAGHDRKHGKWDEMAETIDVSQAGATIRLRRKMRHGVVLYLSLPLPDKLRSHGFGSPGFNVYALVRRVERVKGGVRIIGLEFLGEHPPAGYLETPWSTFRTAPWSGIERRRRTRHSREETIFIEFLNESAQSIAKCMAKTENISQYGARLCVRQAPAEFEIARIVFTGRGFETFATLRNRYLGNDGFERLSFAFIGGELPQ